MQKYVSKFLRETSPVENVQFLSSGDKMAVEVKWKGGYSKQFFYVQDITWEELIDCCMKVVLGYYAAQLETYANSLEKPLIIEPNLKIIT